MQTMETAFPGPSVGDAIRRINSKEGVEKIQRESLSLIEETVNHLAFLTRGINRATPERRQFRTAVERALGEFLQATADPASAIKYVQPEETLTAVLLQSATGHAANKESGDVA